jgi:hypothetical protein
VAREEEILAAEARLGLRLPPSYLRHLRATPDLPGGHGLALLPVSEIRPFRHSEPEWLAGWVEGYEIGAAMLNSGDSLEDDPADPATMPTDQLADTVVISSVNDQRVLLINPASIDPGGEWEAWDFATWYPGAYRYPSFGHLVAALASGA